MDSLFYFREPASSRTCIDAHPKSGTCREIHTGTNLQPLPPDPGASRNRAIYNWTLAVAAINFFFHFFFRSSQTESLSSSLFRPQACSSVSLKHARLPMGHPAGPEDCAWPSGAVVVRFRKGFDGWTGDRLQFKLHEASILVGFGSPALRPISQVFVATAGAGMQQHQLPCILRCRNVRINNVRGAL